MQKRRDLEQGWLSPIQAHPQEAQTQEPWRWWKRGRGSSQSQPSDPLHIQSGNRTQAPQRTYGRVKQRLLEQTALEHVLAVLLHSNFTNLVRKS